MIQDPTTNNYYLYGIGSKPDFAFYSPAALCDMEVDSYTKVEYFIDWINEVIEG